MGDPSLAGRHSPSLPPRGVVIKLHETIRTALADPEVKALYAAQGLVPMVSASPAALETFLRADYERIARLVKIAGIKPE